VGRRPQMSLASFFDERVSSRLDLRSRRERMLSNRTVGRDRSILLVGKE
jgi:hypothetical protein